MKHVVLQSIMYGVTVKKGDNYEKCHLEGEVRGISDPQVAFNEMKTEVEKTLGITISKVEEAERHEKVDTPPEYDRQLTERARHMDEAIEKVEAEVEEPKTEEKKTTRPVDDKARKKEVKAQLDALGVEYNSRAGLKTLEKLLKKEATKTVAEKTAELNILPYDRAIPSHMEKLAEILDEEWPSWKEHIEEVREHISKPLAGKPFIEKDTDKVVDEFRERVNDLISKAIERI